MVPDNETYVSMAQKGPIFVLVSTRFCDHEVVLVRDDATACWPAKSILFIRRVNRLQNREVGETQDKMLRRSTF